MILDIPPRQFNTLCYHRERQFINTAESVSWQIDVFWLFLATYLLKFRLLSLNTDFNAFFKTDNLDTASELTSWTVQCLFARLLLSSHCFIDCKLDWSKLFECMHLFSRSSIWSSDIFSLSLQDNEKCCSFFIWLLFSLQQSDCVPMNS